MLLVFPLLYAFRRSSYLLWLWRAVFMWEHRCVALSSILGARAVCSVDACHCFPQRLLAVPPLLARVADVSSTCSGHWVGPPCSVVVFGLSGVQFVPLAVGSRRSQMCFWVVVQGRRGLERPHWVFLRAVFGWVCSPGTCEDVPWSALPSPHLSLGLPSVGPGVLLAWYSQGHQLSSTEVRFQDHRSGAPGPAVGLWRCSDPGPAQALCARVQEAPSCSGCICSSRGRTRGPHDVVWVLSWHGCQQRRTPAAPGAVGRPRSPAPKPHGPWVPLGFQPRLCAWVACWRWLPGASLGRSPWSCGQSTCRPLRVLSAGLPSKLLRLSTRPPPVREVALRLGRAGWCPAPARLPHSSPGQWGGFAQGGNLPFSSSSQGYRSHPAAFPQPSLHPSCHLEIIPVLSGVWGLLLVFNRCSVRIVPSVEVFFM